jgi:hypothetical protein
MFECVAEEIKERKNTILLTVKDKQDNFPGQRREYLEYLVKEKLSIGDRYLTDTCISDE